ncbi:MAG TPA: lactonase family protein [Pyrinomonadaceae bacterium]|nr:lactonase family protein [Pyrinomonadaceae bacterium]
MANNQLTRRRFLQTAAATVTTIGLSSFNMNSRAEAALEQTLYVGTYTSGKSEGIYIYRLNMSTGELTHFKTIKGVVDPSYLAIDRKRHFLYAVNEVSKFEDQPSGAVSSFAIDRNSGDLTYLNQKASKGASPCYVTQDRTGRFVLLANYESGNVSVLPIKSDGSLGEAVSVMQHTGASINRDRQQGPHAHCILTDKSNRFAFAVDLGIDQIVVYRFNEKDGTLTKHGAVPTKPGAGPRHLTFHRNNRFAYLIQELDSTITAFTYEAKRGVLNPQQTISALPQGFSGTSFCADVHVSPNGKFLYGSNRGHNSIVVFAIDRKSGQLTLVEHASTGGDWPRNFVIDSTGTYLLAANQRSDSVVTFRINESNGRLTPTGQTTAIPAPACLKVVG